MAEKFDPKSVTTFVAVLPGTPLDRVLAEFSGRHTLRTLAAARRVAAKPRKIKIPQGLLRKFYRATGGFKVDCLIASADWPVSDRCWDDGEFRLAKFGDLEMIFFIGKGKNKGPYAWLRYRGQVVAKIKTDTWGGAWTEEAKVRGFAVNLGRVIVPWKETVA